MTRLLTILMLALFALTTPAHAAPLTLSGTATYKEDVTLPSGAMLKVDLVDLADGRRIVGAQSPVRSGRQSSFGFTLNIRSAVPSGNYGLTAEVVAQGKTLFRSMRAVPVSLQEPGPVSILMTHTGVAIAEPPVTPEPALLGTIWQASSIGGEPVAGDKPVTLSISLDRRIGGRSACNSYFAEATIEDKVLVFGPLAATRMACAPKVMAEESRYFAALAAVTSYELAGDSLRLLDAAGVPLVGLVRAQE